MSEKSYSKVSLFIRSLLFWIYSTTSITLYSIICILSYPLPLTTRHAIVRAFIRVYFAMLRIICGIDYHVEGLDNIKGMSAGVVLCKHQSTWETFFLPLIFHTPAVIAKRELSWIPFFGWALAVSKPIFINRKKRSSAMQQIITKGQEYLDSGRWVIVFPEGTRVPYGQAGNYRLGGARLAAATGYPVIPVAHNAGRFWPRRKFIKHPGTVRLVVGPPIQSKDRKPEEVLADAKNWIESTVEKIK